MSDLISMTEELNNVIRIDIAKENSKVFKSKCLIFNQILKKRHFRFCNAIKKIITL